MKKRTTCRASGEPLIPLFSLGDLYVSDFLPIDCEDPSTEKVPLNVMMGRHSGLVQLEHVADMEKFHRSYWYGSKVNESMVRELKGIVDQVRQYFKTNAGDVLVDIGCNDGTLLSFVNDSGPRMTTVGFDPVEQNALDTQKIADHSIHDYFCADSYPLEKKASIITSIAMFYDICEIPKFLSDIKEVMAHNGIWVNQVSYLPFMLRNVSFDDICHEHVCYYTLTILKRLYEAAGLEVIDAQLNDVNGGSLRVYAQKAHHDNKNFGTQPYRNVCKARVDSILAFEGTLNLNDPKTYLDLGDKIKALKEKTVGFIEQEKAKGKTIGLYGASTKSGTLLQYFGLDHSIIDFASERQEKKVGLKMVGTNIPIISDEEMRERNPDYLLLGPWFFVDSFIKRESDYLKNGGAFIVPCPDFDVIRYNDIS